jgi:Domain of unknown function (DUF4136)
MRASKLTSLIVIALVAGCATPPPEPQSMRDPAANFAAYRSFGWAPTAAPGGNDQPLQLLDRNIRAAIAAEMQRKGYAESQDNPQLRIAYETAKADKIENNPVRVGIGVGGWGGNVGGSVNVGSPSVRNFTEGTLVIHAIDAAKNAEVWQGSIAGRLTKGSVEPAAIQHAVSTAMRDFPARTAPGQ